MVFVYLKKKTEPDIITNLFGRLIGRLLHMDVFFAAHSHELETYNFYFSSFCRWAYRHMTIQPPYDTRFAINRLGAPQRCVPKPFLVPVGFLITDRRLSSFVGNSKR